MRRWALLLLMTLAPSAFAKNVVAVHYFDSGNNNEFATLKVGLAQMMATDLINVEKRNYDVVERTELQKVLEELELGHSGAVKGGTAAEVGKLLGVRFFVFGTITELLGTIQINARLVDVETGEILAAKGANGPAAEFLRIEKELAGFIGGKMNAQPEKPASQPRPVQPKRPGTPTPLPSGTGESTERSLPAKSESTRAEAIVATPEMYAPDPKAMEAAQAYSEGLIFMDAGEDVKARERFESALASKPNLAHAKSALATMEI